MAKHRPFTLRFPTGGLDRRFAFQDQDPYTTPDCMNVWPLDVTSGRQRGGVRPGTTYVGTASNDPYHWVTGVYVSSGAKEALFVCTEGGTKSTLDGVTWTTHISSLTPGANNFSSCAVLKGKVYQVISGGGQIQEETLPGTSATDIDDSGTAVPAPEDCGLICAHLDSLWVAGDPANPQIITKCATGDTTDWNTARNSLSAAWSNTGAEGGQIGHAVTGMIAHSGNTLLVGSARATYAIVGNPRSSGSIRRVSHLNGPLSNTAWCKGIGPKGENNTYVFTTDGLAVIPQDSLSIVLLSRDKIPDELRGVEPENGDNVAIGYDARWPGIHITINPNTDDISYFYHIPTDSYWPCDHETRHFQLYPTFTPLQTDGKSTILPMTTIGDMYQFDVASTEEFDSYLDLGPIRLAGPTGEGYIAWISATLAAGSDDCNGRLRAGDSIEEAFYQTDNSHEYTLSPWTRDGYNYSQRPQLGGHAAYLTIFDISNERWIMEEVVGEIGDRGMRRVG
jgi:hypothetical protein